MSTTENYVCRYCRSDARRVATFNLPVPNKYFTTPEAARSAERMPHVLVACDACGSHSLANNPFNAEELFAGAYAFTPVGATWRAHCVDLARALNARLPENEPNARGVIYDIGGNDGLLSSVLYRVCDRSTIVIDPSDVPAFQDGVHWPKRKGFFGEAFARQLLHEGERQADGITATNVLAHVPDPVDFMRGVKTLLAPEGVAVFEFPDGEVFARDVLFDTIYAEHIGYITLRGVIALAEFAGLAVVAFDVTDTHGGSLRVFIKHHAEGEWVHSEPEKRPDFLNEVAARLQRLQNKIAGKKIIGFGSAAKSVVVNALIDNGPQFIIDETPAKIGKYQPGSGAKILPLPLTYREAMSDDEKLADDLLRSAEICVNYAWNYRTEVRDKLTRAGFKGEIVTVHDF